MPATDPAPATGRTVAPETLNPEHVELAGEEKFEIIPVNVRFADARAFHNEVTTGRVEGDNPLFYRERQTKKLCTQHSVNAFLGGPFMDRSDLASARSKARSIDS